ncbi:uncharacterized protein LOC123543513 [Mercenaria mercenaria]|uniref:uncharacterized protein LOC123543513 n=1 Tax=Mercenaria mercenaria TaxID=6596 RepID=UPI00234F0136|nr:uncharacterized protein LOC123543513 [Mercenaria mercenaria]
MEPIKPRDALLGGRTNAVTLYDEVDESTNQEIKYADICSLYPYVNKYKEYSLHHPVILRKEEIDITNLKQYRGLVKCKVLPPQDLWLPVLPMHCNKKMVYTLRRTCAEKKNQTCSHSEEERVLVGVWTSVELNKALDLGYKVLEVYQIWHFKEWSGTVYKEYINKYSKRKQEASGYPNWVKTQADTDKFKSDYFQAEGVILEAVQKNPGKRAVTKTMLNCLWGKNAQNNVFPKSEYIDKLARLYEIMADPHKKVHYFDFFEHEEFSLINYSDYTDMSEPHAAANVVVAAFVTAYARLELYSVLERLGDRVLYFDSCMYIYSPDKYNIPITDSRLGKCTDEVPNKRIVRYVALAPKNYGYEYIVNGERHTVCKVKGITLDYNTTQKVNFNSMIQAVKNRESFSTH